MSRCIVLSCCKTAPHYAASRRHRNAIDKISWGMVRTLQQNASVPNRAVPVAVEA